MLVFSGMQLEHTYRHISICVWRPSLNGSSDDLGIVSIQVPSSSHVMLTKKMR